jgi:GNAT superfamily N-acetyltransferase
MGLCWVITNNGKLVAFITLLADRLQVFDKDRNPKRILKKEEQIEYTSFPAVKIGLLASDKRARHAGRRLVEWAIDYIATEIAPRIGVRFITVDAAYDSEIEPHYDISGFYTTLGFEYAIREQELPPSADTPYRTMFFDLRGLLLK